MNRDTQVNAYLSQLQQDPHNMGVVVKLELLFAEDAQWQKLVEVLFEAAQAASDDTLRARFLLEAARIAELHLNDADLSGDILQRAYQSGQATVVAYEIQLYALVVQQDWGTLEGFFGQADQALAENAVGRSRLYLRLGQILEDSLGDREQADGMYNYAIQLSDQNVGAIIRRKLIAQTTQDWEALSTLILQQINATQDTEEQVALMLDLGDAYALNGQNEEALQCFQNVHQYDANNARAIAGLAKLGVDVGPEAEPTVPVTPPAPVEEVVEEAPEAPVSDIEEISVVEEGELTEMVESSAAVVELSEEEGVEESIEVEDAIEEAPEAVEEVAAEVVTDASEAQEEGETPEEVVAEDVSSEDVALASVEGTEDGADEDVKEDAEDHAEAPSEEDVEDDVEEDVVLEEIVDEPSEPEEEEAPEPEPIHWTERLAQLRAELAQSDSTDAQQSLIGTMARKEWTHREGDDLSHAQAIWQDALNASPEAALFLYDNFHFRYDGASFWQQVDSQADAVGGHDRLRAQIALFQIHDQDTARTLAEATESDDLLQVLADIAPSTDNWRKHQREVELRHGDIADRDAKNVKVYSHMALIGQAMNDPDKVFDMLRRLDRMTDDLGIKGQLQVAYRNQEKWPAYVDLVKQEAAALPDEAQEDKIDLWTVAIDVYTQKMRNDMQAINLYKEILEAQPENVAMIDQLIALYEKNNRTSDQITLLQQKVDLVQSNRAKINILSDIATLYVEKFRNQAEAMKTYEAILEIDARHGDAIEYLKAAYEKRREWEKLIELYQGGIDRDKDPQNRLATRKFIADIAASKMRNMDVAATLWQSALEDAPEDLETIESLETIYEKSRAHEDLSGILERKVNLIDDQADQLKILQKLGLLYNNHLESPDRAINAYARALVLDPDNRKVRLPLENLYVEHNRWVELEALYTDQNAHEELVRTLESLINKQSDDAVKIELLLLAAQNSKKHLDDIQRAERNLSRIHQQFDPDNEQAALALEEIYTQTQDYAALQGVLQIILKHRDTPETRRPYQLKLASLAERQFEDLDNAFAWHAQILREDVNQVNDTTELERVAAAADAWPLVVDIYKDALDIPELPLETSQTIRMKLGLVYAQHLQAFDQAQALFESILAEDESHDGALAAMEHIFRHQERWQDLLGVYERRLSLVDVPEKRVQILQGMATLAEEQAQDVDVAIAKYLEAYAIEPKNAQTLAQLHRLYSHKQQHTEQADIIRQEIALIHEVAQTRSGDVASGKIDASSLVPPSSVASESSLSEESDESGLEEASSQPDVHTTGLGEMSSSDVEDAAAQGLPLYADDELEQLAGLNYELGTLCMRHLERPQEAVDCFGQVVLVDPNHEQAPRALESLLNLESYGPQHVQIAAQLDPVYELHGQWNELLRVLHIQAKDDNASPAQKAEFYKHIGHVHVEELGNAQDGSDAYGQSLALVPDQEDVRAQLNRLAAVLEDWPSLIKTYEGILPDLGFEAEPLRLSYLYELARINANRINDIDRAELYYQTILDAKPDATQALEELEDLYMRTEQWRSVLDVYERKKDLAEGDEAKMAMDFQIASVWENMLQEPQKAIEVHKSILEKHPAQPDAIHSLDRIYRNENMWQEAANNIAYELSVADESQQLDIKHRQAEVYELQLEDADTATTLYEEILTENPMHLATLESMARVMQSEAPAAKRASLILEPLYEESGRIEDLIIALYVQVERGDDPEHQRALLHRIAALSEHQLQDANGAFTAYGHALRYGPDDALTLSELERLSVITLDHKSLVGFYEQAAAHIEDHDTKRDVLHRAANLYIDKLSDVESAAARYHDVLAFEPSNMESIDKLIQIYQYTEQWDDFGKILIHKADQLDEGTEQKPLLFQASTVYREFVEMPEAAVEANKKILEIDPVDLDAIQNLEHLYTQLTRWNDLLDIFNVRLDLAEDDNSRKELLFVIGAIQQQELEQPHDAIRTYNRILEIDPQEVNALIKLEELDEQTEQWDELLGVLQRQIELSTEPDARNNLSYRFGEVLEKHHDDTPGAIDAYRQVLGVDPNHTQSIAALENIIKDGQYAVDAAEVLQPVFDSQERWDDLIHVYRLRLDHTDDPEQKLEFLREVASIEEGCKNDKPSAFQTYAAALSLAPDREDTLETMTRLAGDLQAWDPYIDYLDAIMDNTDDPVATMSLQRSVAKVYDQQIVDPGASIDRYVRVLESDPNDEASLVALTSLYQNQARWQDLTEVLQRRIPLTDDQPTHLQLQLQLASVQRNMLEKPEAALETYRAILQDDPDQAMAIEGLEDMFMDGQVVQPIAEILEPHYLSRGEHESLINLYRQRLGHLEDPIEQHDVLRQIARVYSQEMQDDTNALTFLGEALVVHPSAEGLLEDLDECAIRLEEQSGPESWTNLTGYYVRALENPNLDEATALNMWLKLANIIDERLQAPESAEVAYTNALVYDPGEPTALAALDRIYLQGQRWDELANVLERRIAETVEDETLVDLNARLGTLYKDTLLDRQKAIGAFESVLKIEPEHLESLQALESLYMGEGRFEDLYRSLKIQSELTYDGDEQAQFYLQMAQLCEDNLNRRDEAIDLLNQVIQQQPNNVGALMQLRRLYLMEERWDDLVSVIEMEIELTSEEEERLGLYENLGVIFSDRINDEQRALEAWSAALELDEDYLPALEALRDIYTSRGDYVERSRMLARMLKHQELDQERRLDLWVEQADIQGNMLMESDEAIHAWQQVLALSPGDPRAVDSLEFLFDQDERWEELMAVLEVKADNLYEEPEARLEVLRKLADRSENKLQDTVRAAQYHEQILEITGFDEDAYTKLEASYMAQGSEESYSQLVNLYLDRSGQVAEDSIARAEVLRKASGVFENNLGAAPSALVVLLSALDANVIGDEELLDEAERLAKVNEDAGQPAWGDVVNRYAEVLPEVTDDHDAYVVNLRLGRLLAKRLGQPDDAVYYLKRALMHEPNQYDVLVLLAELYEQLASWPELAETQTQLIEVTEDPEEKIDRWRTLGNLYESQLANPDQAIMAYEQILAIDVGDAQAIASLERIYEVLERWESLIDILRQKAQVSFEPEEVVAIQHRIASIYGEQLGNSDRAVGAYLDVMESDPSNLPALQALEGLYRQKGDWQAVIDNYEAQLNVVDTPEEQIFIYGKMANDYEEQFQNRDEAVNAYIQVLGVEPSHEGAIENLERLYYEMERWHDLVEIVETHISITQMPDQKVNLLNELARVWRDKVKDLNASIEAFVRSLEINTNQPEVYTELTQLYEQTTNYESAIETLRSHINVSYDAPTRVGLFYRIGELYETQLFREADAEDAHMEALKLDPGYKPSLEALQGLYERRGDWQGVIRVLKQSDEHSKDFSEKAIYMSAIGRVYDERLDDMVSAVRYYEQAQEFDPQVVTAAEPLIDVYMRDQRYERALPLLRRLLQSIQQEPTPREPAELHLRYLQMAQTTEKLSLYEESLDYYHRAYEIDPTSMDGLMGLGRQLYRHEDFEQALKIYQSLQLQHLEHLSHDQARDLFYHCGLIKQRVGDRRRAVEFFENALEYDAQHPGTLSALIENYEAAGMWDRYIQMQYRLIEAETEPAAKYAQLTRVGDIYLNQLQDANNAVQVYLQALDIQPNSVVALRKLLDLFTKMRRWVEAVSMLERLIEIETDPGKKAKLAYTIGVIYRDEIRDPRAAVDPFNRALDLDINLLKAFEAINRILTDLKDWKGLERAYRSMLKRLQTSTSADDERFGPVKYMLWEGLGEIYRSRLKHMQSAIQAFEMASELKPDSEKLHLILAELYDVVQDAAGSIKHHRRIILNDPFKMESYRSLFKAYIHSKAYDKAWCMASALSFLQSANETEERFYQEYLGNNLKAAKAKFSPDAFRRVYHPEQDMIISVIMQQLFVVFAPAYARDLRDLGLHKKKDLLDPNGELHFCKIYSYVAERLAPVGLIPTPQLYLRRDQAIGMLNANVIPTSFVVGADMFQGKDERELAFLCAKRLGWMLPQHYLGSCGHPTEYLKAWFMAAMHITDPSLGIDRTLGPSGPSLIQAIQEAERRQPGLTLQIQKLMRQFLSSGKNPNLSHWLTTVDHTTNRLGLLLCGDLKKAIVCIKNDSISIGKATIKERIRELVLFSISEEYFELRAQMGLAIGS